MVVPVGEVDGAGVDAVGAVDAVDAAARAAWHMGSCSTRLAGCTNSPGNTMCGSHCGSASRASSAGSGCVRDQPKAKVCATTSAISQPVLLGLSGSASCISRHTPACVGSCGRNAHRQCEGRRRQAAQRSPLGPPRARNGRVLRARRASRKRATACGATACGTVACWAMAGVGEAARAATNAVAAGESGAAAGADPAEGAAGSATDATNAAGVGEGVGEGVGAALMPCPGSSRCVMGAVCSGWRQFFLRHGRLLACDSRGGRR